MAADFAEEFILRFHSLEGPSLGEKRKNLFVLLNKNSSLKDNVELLDLIAANLKPTCFLGKLFKIEFLIYFQRTNDLFNLLKEDGNEIVIKKIVKHDWFFKSAFNTIEPEELINEILPSLSFSVRMKVLKKLSKCVDDEHFDKIYDVVLEHYGTFLASKFICGCGAKKLKEILPNYSGTLSSKQLTALYRKDPDLINLINNRDTEAYKDFLRYIYNVNHDLYDYVKDNMLNASIKLGRRMTKGFVRLNKTVLIESPNEYFSKLHIKVVIRQLGRDALEFYKNSLPPQIQDYSTNSPSYLLKYFPENLYYRMRIKIVESRYQIKFADYSDLINEEILKLIADKAERAFLAKAKVDACDDRYIKYLLTKDSIPIIKEKIVFTSNIDQRNKYLQELIETCHINNDLEALSEVLKYMCVRHKNEEYRVQKNFINTLERLFNVKDFTEEMKNTYKDLLMTYKMKFEPNSLAEISFSDDDYAVKETNHEKLARFEKLFNKKESVDHLVLEFLVREEWLPPWGSFTREFEKYLLLFFMENVGEIYEGLANTPRIAKIVIEKIIKWNRTYKDDHLSLYDFPFSLCWFNLIIRYEPYVDYIIKRLFKQKIFTTKENHLRKEYLQIYWKRFHVFGDFNDIKWFLRYDPIYLTNNFDEVVKKLFDLKVSKFGFYIFKKSTHLQLDNKLIQFCTSKLNDTEYEDSKSKFVLCLSILLEPEKFAEIADSFKPAEKTLDLKNEKEVKLYNLQNSIGQHFKNTKSSKVFSSLLNYCAGDYFKCSMRSLYSIMYNTPENLLPHYLKNLSNKAVSVRKHALYLTCELTSITRTAEILQFLNIQEKDVSLRKYLFRSTVKYCIKNPSDQIFKMIKSNIINLSQTDEESLDFIMKGIDEIPAKYKAAYVRYSWEHFEKIINVWKKLKPLKTKLLEKIIEENMVAGLPLDFIFNIIEKHFLVREEIDFNFNLMSDLMFLSFYNRNEKSIILETVLNQIKSKDKDVVFKFFNHWYSKIMSKDIDITHIEPYLDFFTEKINTIDNFCDYIKLFLLRTKLEAMGQPSDVFATKIVKFLNHLCDHYGSYVAHIFFEEFKSSVYYFTESKISVRDFYFNLINNHLTPVVAVMILNTIKACNLNSTDRKSVLQKIKDMDDIGIQIFLKTCETVEDE